jgi:hypothetical protein
MLRGVETVRELPAVKAVLPLKRTDVSPAETAVSVTNVRLMLSE